MGSGQSTLLEPAGTGNLDAVRAALASGADISGTDDDGNTALHLAAKNGHQAVVQALIEKKADLTRTNESELTPLLVACYAGHTQIVELLLVAGASINDGQKTSGHRWTPLLSACRRDSPDLVTMLLKRGADPLARLGDGKTALHVAVGSGSAAVIRILLDAGVKDLPDNAGQTALELAEKKGKSECAALLRGKYKVVFVLGGPGAGKGTQCANIAAEFNYAHLSAGDLLRAEQASGSEIGEMIGQFIKEGKIVPVEVTVGLLKTAIQKSGKSRILIDGFPRNANNLDGWYSLMSDSADIDFVLFLDCPEDVMEQRLLARGKDSGRADDNLEVIKKRFTTYVQETTPIIREFEKQGKLVKVSSRPPREEVYQEVRKYFSGEATPASA
eukprot:TRINITY_DN751_c0_g1_i1.p1 TRINITY_DN751_c0_g1~~TRINITY_DN751_c0_g1_i1.p1  ORF type:complete len:394 (-),score=98.96 TRINITY_DN751_c0_g1_i1:51-1211(-)